MALTNRSIDHSSSIKIKVISVQNAENLSFRLQICNL